MNERKTLTCRNCGGDILDDGRSPTGLVHAATERTRCDGQMLPFRKWSSDEFDLAVRA